MHGWAGRERTDARGSRLGKLRSHEVKSGPGLNWRLRARGRRLGKAPQELTKCWEGWPLTQSAEPANIITATQRAVRHWVQGTCWAEGFSRLPVSCPFTHTLPPIKLLASQHGCYIFFFVSTFLFVALFWSVRKWVSALFASFAGFFFSYQGYWWSFYESGFISDGTSDSKK